MKLLTKALRKQLPPLYTTEHEEDPLVICKFFHVLSHWKWYAIEFDGDDTFFGWVYGDFPELGYFTLSELESLQGAWNLPVERDCFFRPRRLSQVKAEHGC